MPKTAGVDASWMTAGICVDIGYPRNTMFFADDGRTAIHKAMVRQAKAMCHDCPAKAACLDYALVTGQRGIWGGTTERERSRMLKRR